MFVPTEGYEAAARGSRLKGVTCEQCGQQYAYVLVRAAVGRGSSVMGLDDGGAYSRAQHAAAESLKRKLSSDADVVPCPSCGHVQREMAARLRRRRLRRLFRWSVIGTAMILAGAVLTACNCLGAGIGLLSMGLLLLGYRLWFWLIDYAHNRLPDRWRTPADHADRKEVWTRQQLEAAARADPGMDISDALLDWESQRHRPA